MAATDAKIDFGLLRRFTDLILCSRCLRRGRRTRVAQVISPRHRLLTLCPECSAEGRAAMCRAGGVTAAIRAHFGPQ